MVNTKIVISLILIIAAAIVFFIFFPNEEDKIKKQFKFITEQMAKIEGENPVISAGKANQLKKVFADTVHVEAPAYSFSRQIVIDDLSQYIMQIRHPYQEIYIKFEDFFIDFPSENRAQVITTSRMGGISRTGERVEDIHELDCDMIKKEDIWKINAIEIVEVLKK